MVEFRTHPSVLLAVFYSTQEPGCKIIYLGKPALHENPQPVTQETHSCLIISWQVRH